MSYIFFKQTIFLTGYTCSYFWTPKCRLFLTQSNVKTFRSNVKEFSIPFTGIHTPSFRPNFTMLIQEQLHEIYKYVWTRCIRAGYSKQTCPVAVVTGLESHSPRQTIRESLVPAGWKIDGQWCERAEFKLRVKVGCEHWIEYHRYSRSDITRTGIQHDSEEGGIYEDFGARSRYLRHG